MWGRGGFTTYIAASSLFQLKKKIDLNKLGKKLHYYGCWWWTWTLALNFAVWDIIAEVGVAAVRPGAIMELVVRSPAPRSHAEVSSSKTLSPKLFFQWGKQCKLDKKKDECNVKAVHAEFVVTVTAAAEVSSCLIRPINKKVRKRQIAH